MINDSPFGPGSLTVAAGGFEATGHPIWVIERKWQDRAGLSPATWVDAFQYYEADDTYEDCVNVTFDRYYSSPVQYNPVELRKILIRLREMYPEDEFRMVIRVEMQMDVGF